MVQATTPTFILTLPDTVDLSQAANIYFSLRQKSVIIEKSGDDLTGESKIKSVWQRIKGFVLLYLRSDVGNR